MRYGGEAGKISREMNLCQLARECIWLRRHVGGGRRFAWQIRKVFCLHLSIEGDRLSQDQGHGSALGCRLRRVSQGNFKKDIPAAAKEQIKELHHERDNWHGLVFLALDWLVIAIAVVATLWSGFHPAVYLAAVVVVGSRQR